MILTQYGLTFKLLDKSNIDLLRYWRNHPSITKFMVNKTYISPKMQEEWFQKINKKGDLYFIIYSNDLPIGNVSITDINHEEKICEGGIFIWNVDFIENQAPLLSSLFSLEYVFKTLQLKTTFATVLKSNKRAIQYNKRLGYEQTNSNSEFLRMKNTSEQFYTKANKYIRAAKKLF